MILDMSLATFTMVHVIISLTAIAAGLVVMVGMLCSKQMPGPTAIFLLFNVLTSVTGFMFPFNGITPGILIGILSCILLTIACTALYAMHLAGAWRWIYLVTALVSLYLNVFVLVIQSFLKVPALAALAPSVPPAPPSGPVFAVVQGIVLVFFVVLTIGAWRRYRPMTVA